MIIVYSKKGVFIEYFCKYIIHNVQFVLINDFDEIRLRAAKFAAFFTFVYGVSYYGRTNFCEVKKYEKESRARVRRKVV